MPFCIRCESVPFTTTISLEPDSRGLDPGIPERHRSRGLPVKPGNDDNGRSVNDGYFFSNTSFATSAAVIAAGQPA